MNSRRLILLLTICLSIISSIYGILLIVTPYHYDTSKFLVPQPLSTHALIDSYGAISLSFGVVGWILTFYQLHFVNDRKVTKNLRKELSGTDVDGEIYDSLKKRGGINRLSILDSLHTPKLRNQIARITKIDWKEVDRNLRVLESINLVRVQYKNGSFSVYELTDRGKEILRIVKTIVVKTKQGME